jgi:hypothetical protein
MNKIRFLIIISFFLVSCGGMKEAGKVLRNEKTRTTDEFLVKQKDPLVLPPDYSEIPRPESLPNKKKNDEEKIRKILKAPNENIKNRNTSSTIEKSILDKIRK